MPGDTTVERQAPEPEAIVATFKTGDESEFQKPDHDPHGETQASAAHSHTSCDNPDCDTTGKVPTATLDYASSHSIGPARSLVCSDECANEL